MLQFWLQWPEPHRRRDLHVRHQNVWGTPPVKLLQDTIRGQCDVSCKNYWNIKNCQPYAAFTNILWYMSESDILVLLRIEECDIFLLKWRVLLVSALPRLCAGMWRVLLVSTLSRLCAGMCWVWRRTTDLLNTTTGGTRSPSPRPCLPCSRPARWNSSWRILRCITQAQDLWVLALNDFIQNLLNKYNLCQKLTVRHSMSTRHYFSCVCYQMLGLLVACLSHDLDHRGTDNSLLCYQMLGLLVACLSHDLDHRGTNNSLLCLLPDVGTIGCLPQPRLGPPWH